MSFEIHGKGYFDPRSSAQIDRLYAWKHGLYFPPAVVEINPTAACVQKCRYCYPAGRTMGTMPDDVLIRLLPELAQAGVGAVVFQGTGEPLMHRALPDAIAAGAKHGLPMCVTTNGVLLDATLQEKILPLLTYIKFSNLDHNAKRYAYTHGCPEHQWTAVVNNIRQAIAFRERHNLPIFYLATVYLTKENFSEAAAMVQFCKNLGLDYLLIQEAVYCEFSYTGPEKQVSQCFTPEQIQNMKTDVAKLMDKNFCVKVRFPLSDGTFINGRYQDCWVDNWCLGIQFNTIINADGEVYPCYRYWGVKKFSYGNIKEKKFEEIWKDERRKRIEQYTMTTPPKGDECSTCSASKTNEILYTLWRASVSKWVNFLTN